MVVACGALGDVQMGDEVMSKKFHDLNRGGHSTAADKDDGHRGWHRDNEKTDQWGGGGR